MTDAQDRIGGAHSHAPPTRLATPEPSTWLNLLYTRSVALRAEVYGILARRMEPQAMLQGCAAAIVRHFDVSFARVWTLPPNGTVLALQASAGDYTRLDGSHSRIPVGALKIGEIAQTRRSIVTNDVRNDPRIEDHAWAKREGMVAFAGVPLVVDDRVVGVLALFARRHLEPETCDALESIAAAIAQGVERLRSEDELRRSETYLAEAQRLTHTGSWAVRLSSRERFWSHEMFRICGFPIADAPPVYEAVLERVHADDRPRVQRALDESLYTGAELRVRFRFIVPGQPPKWLEMYGRPERDAAGHIVELIGSTVDVTARVRSARRLRRATHERFAAVLAERTRIARDMHDGLLQDLASISLQLGAVLPHVQRSPAMAEERLRAILASAERAGHAARLALTNMRGGNERDDLARAVERCAQATAASYGGDAPFGTSDALQLTVRVRGESHTVAPPVRDAAVAIVEEAVRNVRRHSGARAVMVSIFFSRRCAVVTVRDNGRGFATTADDGAGHWGIVGMRERAAEIGGTLTVSSVIGSGSVVRVRLPLHR